MGVPRVITHLRVLRRPVHPDGAEYLEGRRGRAFPALGRYELRRVLCGDLADGGLVEEHVHRAEIDVQREGEWVFPDRFGAEVSLQHGGVLVDLLDNGVVAVPEAAAVVVGADGGNVVVAEACECYHQHYGEIGRGLKCAVYC